MSKYFGKEISPILIEIADALWEIDARPLQEPYEFSDEAYRAICKIFMSGCVDQFWALAEKKDWSQDEREKRVAELGNDLRQFTIKHLEIDPHDFYKGDKQ